MQGHVNYEHAYLSKSKEEITTLLQTRVMIFILLEVKHLSPTEPVKIRYPRLSSLLKTTCTRCTPLSQMQIALSSHSNTFDMATHQAIILPGINLPLTLASVPTPAPQSGQVLIKVLASPILAYYRAILPGKRPYPLSLPLTPGVSPIGRIEATGSDTTALKPGQLVYVDLAVRARDDPLKEHGTIVLQGLFVGITPEARILSENDWRHGSWAEKQLVPLENVHVLDESLLCAQMGYSPARLTWINTLLVPYGGLLSGALQPGRR